MVDHLVLIAIGQTYTLARGARRTCATESDFEFV
jgi:hypothetical protein